MIVHDRTMKSWFVLPLLIGIATFVNPPIASANDSLALRIRSNTSETIVEGYSASTIQGWAVLVSESLQQKRPAQTKRALELLEDQMIFAKRVLPAKVVARLVDVPIWFSPTYEGFRPSGEYHPGAEWLKRQGRRPELHRCIEFTNVPIFEKEVKRMPVLLLHELAHAYHDQVLGFDHAEIHAVYDAAKSAGRYDAVLRHNGKTERAYAITNDREYFAETSEAYFGRNDFFPFNRKELQGHDPRMTALLGRLWGVEPESK